VDSTIAWLRAHPGIEIVSRDRSSVYSEAAVRAAPQATQIADRWHLLSNLSEALIGALAPHHRLMTEAAQAVRGKPSPDAVEKRCATSRTSRKEAARQRSRERRMAIYETAMGLVRGGLPQPDVARRLSIDSRTIRRWVESNGFPEQSPRWREGSLDRHREYLDQRWQQGCHNAAQLWRELHEKGFEGQSRIVRDWMLKHPGTRASEAKKNQSYAATCGETCGNGILPSSAMQICRVKLGIGWHHRPTQPLEASCWIHRYPHFVQTANPKPLPPFPLPAFRCRR
jgi:transposase